MDNKTPIPIPLGARLIDGKLEFSLYSSTASAVTLLLFTNGKERAPDQVPLHKGENDIWRVEIPPPNPEIAYLFDVDGHVVLDPYAKALTTPFIWGKDPGRVFCHVTYDEQFDWEGITSPGYAKKDLIIYEMHVRGFTYDASSHIRSSGTFLGIIEKIPYLKDLGINAVELLPCMEFDETENHRIDPTTKNRLYNYWGYSTLNFFCVMNRYVSFRDRLGAIREFKLMVRELHRAGIEVILDVVYNHTSLEHSLNYIDERAYYILTEDGKHTNFSGCGNTVNANSFAGKNLILSSLKYFREEMHVDGFRLDLGGCLVRGEDGAPLRHPPVYEAIEKDPVLQSTKFFAEPWDCGGINLTGSFPLKGASEWNGEFRTHCRRFLRGDVRETKIFQKMLLGLPSIFQDDALPVNYPTCHDGFSLMDLVSYTHKHNVNNGENNKDGESESYSSNCGVEGATTDPAVLFSRHKLIYKFFLTLFFSRGIPMIKMGDEYGHTHNGNNNPYCQDSSINWFNWDMLGKNQDIFSFVQKAIRIRKKGPHLLEDLNQAKRLMKVFVEDGKFGFFIGAFYFFGLNNTNKPWELTSLLKDQWEVVIASDPEQYSLPLKLLPHEGFLVRMLFPEEKSPY
jgi:isoamylase